MPKINEEFLITKEGYKGCKENDLVKVVEEKNDLTTESVIYKFFNVTQNQEVSSWIHSFEFEALRNFRVPKNQLSQEALIELMSKAEAQEDFIIITSSAQDELMSKNKTKEMDNNKAIESSEKNSLAIAGPAVTTPPEPKKEYHKFWVPKKFVTKEKSKKTGKYFYIVDYQASVTEDGKPKTVHYHVFLSYNQLTLTDDNAGYDGWIEKNVLISADKHVRTKEINSDRFIDKFPRQKMKAN